MKILLTILLVAPFYSWAQVEFEVDSLRYSNRLGGRIDSVDVVNACESSIADGGLASYGYSAFQIKYLTSQLQRPVYLWEEKRQLPMKFSALPHLGFAYGIGAQATQFVRAAYQQSFSDSTILNIDFLRNSSNGYLRHSVYAESSLNLRFLHIGQRFSIRLDASYNRGTKSHPGGVTTDTLIDAYGLEYTPVRSLTAESMMKKGGAEISTFTHLLKNENGRIGLLTRHNYSIINRVFSEADTIYALYDQVYIDSFKTNDQVNLPHISNAVGMYYSSSRFYTELSASHAYWRLDNMGLSHDTVETRLHHRLSLTSKQWVLKNQFEYNLTGAFSSHRNELSAGFVNSKFKSLLNFNYKNEIPHPLQRYYYSNNYYFQISNPDKNSNLSLELDAEYQLLSFLKTGLKFEYQNLIKQYYLVGSELRNDTLQNYQFGTAELHLNMEWKWFNLRTRVIYAHDPENMLPGFQSYSRVYIKTKLFKAKKLEFIFGGEPVYISNVKPISYVHGLDFYTVSNPVQVSDMFNLHAFLNLGIDEFRFYFRFENIGYFWNRKSTMLMSNYPLPGTRFRVGISWDFFN